MPAKFGLDARRDVQVLCPMHRGPAGAGTLNLLLQEALTPYREGAPERRYGGRVFRVGDKVTQRGNNYERFAQQRMPEGLFHEIIISPTEKSRMALRSLYYASRPPAFIATAFGVPLD